MVVSKLWYYALSIGSIAGTLIGVGIFALPYASLQAGFLVTAFYLFTFGIIVGFTHLFYLEVTFRTKADHRFTGYVGKYLGKRWKTITFVQGLITLWGTLLIYTIIAATFLSVLFSSYLSETTLGVLFFIVGSLVVWRGDSTVGKQEVWFTLPMAILVVVIFVQSFFSPYFSVTHLSSFDVSKWVLPYGIVLFSLSGFTAIPVIEHILAPARKKGMSFNYPFIVLSATIIPAFLYILFTWGVLGVSGETTSKDALTGLIPFLGQGIIGIGALLAVFAMYTSFIAIGNELSKTFYEDYHLARGISFLFTLTIPLVFYLLNVRDFIGVTEFVGAVMGGYVGILSILLFWKAKHHGDQTPPFSVHLPKPIGIFIIAIFAFASLYAVFDIVSPYILASLSG